MADKKYSIDFTMSDGTTESVEFTAPQGDPYTLTEADKSEIAEIVKSDMYIEGTKAPYTNVLPSADTATLLSGDLTTAAVKEGYFEGVRLNSSGLTKAQSGYCATGFIPYTYKGASDIIRLKGVTIAKGSYTQELCFYNSSHAFLGYAGFGIASDNPWEELLNAEGNNTVGWKVEKESDGEYLLSWIPSKTNAVKNATVNTSDIAYIRIGLGDFANAIITINEEIVGGTSEVGGSSTQTYLNTRNTYIAPVPSGYCESKLTFTDFNTKVTDVLKSDTALRAMIDNFRAIASANPDYITETLLGKDASGTYDIYKYELDLKPAMGEGYSSVMNKDKPVFIITAGLHGIEPDAVYEVYHFMQDICGNFMESDYLEYLRTNVKFVIVPISNPWGFVNGTYNNSNNVNLNKNFEHGFSKVTNATNTQLNTGENPYSEAETVLLKSVFDEYKNAVFHLECHGKAGADASYNDVIWFSLMESLASGLIEISANNVIHQIGRKLYKMGYNEGKTEGGYITYYTLNGRPKDYTGTKYGMLSCTMEGTGRMSVAGHTTFTKDEQRINCEALENFVLNVLALLNSRVEI